MDPFTVLQLGSAAAGIIGGIAGAGKKSEGVAQNKAAMDAITAEQLQRQAEQDRQAYEIAKWYNGRSSGLLDKTIANTGETIAGGDAGAILSARDKSAAAREKAGIDLISSSPAPTNYSDNAPDETGAVKSENARQLVKALDLGKARASSAAKVNAYGDALLDTGISTTRGTQNQQGINREQKAVDRKAMMRSKLNEDTHVPVLSAQDKYRMAGGAGQDGMTMGSALQAKRSSRIARSRRPCGSTPSNSAWRWPATSNQRRRATKTR